jgi:FkbM family methyltransferase
VENKIQCRTNEFIQKHIAVFGVWEPVLTRYIIEKRSVEGIFVDVGANVGYFTLLASAIYSNVIAFEPSPSIHTELVGNVALNGLKNVRSIQAAIAQDRRVAEFYRATGPNLGLSSLVRTSGAAFEQLVTCAPLQDFISESEWPRVKFVKIDVEGSERGVIMSLLASLDLLAEDVEIVVETNGPDDSDSQEIFRILTSHGFLAYDLLSEYSLQQYQRRPADLPQLVSELPNAFTDCLFRRALIK